MTTVAPAVVLDGVVKDHQRGVTTVRAVDEVSLEIAAGEFVGVVGPSGAGKTTLLHLMGGLQTPTSGRVVVAGHDLAAFSDRELTTFRRTHVGFVFQFFNLIPTLAAWENVALPRVLDGGALRDHRTDAEALLARVGIADRSEHAPAELSGGELQRVAIARALICRPALVLADEPTGNLDTDTGALVLDQLRGIVRGAATLVLVSHDPVVASRADRVIRLTDGRVAS